MTWERCPHKYLLEKVTEAPQKPAVYFAGGTAVHLMTEALDTGQAPSGAKFTDYFYPEVERLMEAHDGLYWDTKKWLAGADSLDDWLEIGPRCVDNWSKFSDASDMEKHKHLRDIELDVTGILPGCDVPIKGFIDRMGWFDGKHLVIDIKTGKSKPKDYFQLATYVNLLAVKYEDMSPKKVSFFMARQGKETGPMTIQPYLLETGERYGKAYAEMVEAAETGEYPYKREFTCKWCPVQDSCLAYSGDTRMAKANDPYYTEGKPVY